jgi:zinc/manganese transport system permease protein
MSLLQTPYMRDALLAGTGIAAACGIIGYFVVLRSEVFATDALSHVAFTGTLAALAIGINARLGLFGATIAVAILLALIGPRERANDAAIGVTFAGILGVGVLCLSIFTTSSSGENGAANIRVLFGSIFGLSHAQAITAAIIGVVVCGAVIAITRPLLFASIDPAIAGARGVPVRLLGIVFLALVGVGAAEASQAVGALLLVGLIAAPAGAAHRLTTRPSHGIVMSIAIALGSVWLGLAASYQFDSLPPSFCIMAIATAVYGCAFVIAPRLRA